VRALVQRVSEASVTAGGEEVARIGRGLVVLLGVRRGDTEAAADRLAAKLLALRVFEDGGGKMNLSVGDAGGELLCVSQFTLYGDTRKGNRPSFVTPRRPRRPSRSTSAYATRSAQRAACSAPAWPWR
jgi:D-aminoacyl-tRNA deacylase